MSARLPENTRKIILKRNFHPLQKTIADAQVRFKVVVCGRRWGKTRLAGMLAITEALTQAKRIWWVAPILATSKIAWRLLKPLVRKIPGAIIRESEKVFCFPSGGEIWFKSADNPDNLRGEGIDGLVLDEADYTPEYIWSKVLRPMLADRRGWALFISTPREQGGWFHKLYQRGQEGLPHWQSWTHPSWTNPFLDPEEIDQARSEMSEFEFRQEFGAEFIGTPDNVYHNFEVKLHVKPTPFDPSLPVYVALDFNNSPRVAVFSHFINDTFKVTGEIHYPNQATTDEHAEMCAAWLESRGIKRENPSKEYPNGRFPAHKVQAIPDASGASLRHGGGTNHQDFRKAGFTIIGPAANPHIIDRDNKVLAYLKNAKGQVRTQIDPSCRHLIEAFQKFKHKGRDGSPWGHILDAWGYTVSWLTRPQGRTQREVDGW